jgi:hypothetical protein
MPIDDKNQEFELIMKTSDGDEILKNSDTVLVRFGPKRNGIVSSWLNGGYNEDLSAVFNHQLSQENIDIKDYQDGFNETSIWLEFNIEGQNVVIGGDSGKAGMDMMMRLYQPETLTFDVYFVLHHGSNATQEWIDTMTCKTVMHPYHYFDTALPLNVALTEKAFRAGGEYLVEGDGTTVLTFPYKVGEFKRLSHNTWKYHQGQKRVWD